MVEACRCLGVKWFAREEEEALARARRTGGGLKQVQEDRDKVLRKKVKVAGMRKRYKQMENMESGEAEGVSKLRM